MVTITGVGAMPAQFTPINEYAVMSIPAVWRGVNWLAGTLASLPKAVSTQTGRVYQPAQHPLNKMLARKMNPVITSFVFWETFFHHAVLWGNAYGLIVRQPGTLKTSGIFNLDPEKVIPFRFNGLQWYYVKDLKGPGQHDVVPAADMLHVPGLGYDGMQGYPLVSILADTFEWAKNAQKFSGRYFQRGTQVQGAVEIPATVTKDQADQILDMVRRKHSGIESDYSYLVLSGGAKLNNTTQSPEQSQLIETTEAANLAIARILGVYPWHIFEFGRATWGNSETQAIEAVKYSLRPWIEKTEEELASKILTDDEQDKGLVIRFDVEDLIRGDSTTITTNSIAKLNAGIINQDESRAECGYVPTGTPEAKKFRVPGNFPVPGQSPSAPPPEQKNARKRLSPQNLLSKLQPILDDACARVDNKTNKAFANKANKPDAERTVFVNVFAEEQAQFVREALAPLAQIVDIPTNTIADRYAGAIRRRGTTGETTKLSEIINNVLRGNNESESKAA